MNQPRSVRFLIYPGVASYDVAGPAQAFRTTGLSTYDVALVSVLGGVVESDCPGVSFDSISADTLKDPIDTLIIPGGTDAPEAANDPALVRCIERLAGRARRVACVCTGAFLAAEAGLLSGRRAVTHWNYCDAFQRRFPDVRLERDPIWLRDGIWTSAGVSAGVDLTLALIEEDLGADAALQAARMLVVFLKRPGGQSQLSTLLSGQIAAAGGPLRELLAWIADNLAADLRTEILAEKAGMSSRTLVRTCVSQTGMTPAKLVEALRVQAAREAVERNSTPLGKIAARYGFADEQRMRRAFVRHAHTTPSEMRARSGIYRDHV